jgi:hypothetical protein
MAPRIQIVLSSRPPAETGPGAPLGFWQRFKVFFVVSIVILVALAALVFLLAVGSIVAAVLWIVVAIAIVSVAIKAALKRARTITRL